MRKIRDNAKRYIILDSDEVIGAGRVSDLEIQLDMTYSYLRYLITSARVHDCKQIGLWGVDLKKAEGMLRPSQKEEANDISYDMLGERYF